MTTVTVNIRIDGAIRQEQAVISTLTYESSPYNGVWIVKYTRESGGQSAWFIGQAEKDRIERSIASGFDDSEFTRECERLFR